jgi:hypothetical protein
MFSKSADGTITARFGEEETELLVSLSLQLIQLLDPASRHHSDPAVARLLPSAYPDDEQAAAEFRRFTEEDLAGRKVANAETVVASLGDGTGVSLDRAQADAWLRSLTDIRLTLAARLGIQTDADLGNVSTEDGLMMRDVYDWLGYVQEALVRSVAS